MGQSGGASCRRVCYQRGLTRLVFLIITEISQHFSTIWGNCTLNFSLPSNIYYPIHHRCTFVLKGKS